MITVELLDKRIDELYEESKRIEGSIREVMQIKNWLVNSIKESEKLENEKCLVEQVKEEKSQ
jgi:hypothetical protein